MGKIVIKIFSALFACFLFCSCTQKKANDNCYLIYGSKASSIEMDAIKDLKKDLVQVGITNLALRSDDQPLPDSGTIFILGTAKSNALLQKLIHSNNIEFSNTFPGSRGGIWAKTNLENEKEVIIIAGSDTQGMRYAIYDYSKTILGVDPLAYWTGKNSIKKNKLALFDFENKTIYPPKVPILCYFENDVDELANYRGKLLEYDWESYTELINSLVRLRYNAIQFFDMLGRPEFFLRPEYKKLSPDYEIDLAYLDKMIDYAHSKGMKVQIDFGLGYQIHPMSSEKATCWGKYKNDWIDYWKYYLEETPLSKTDIFVLRPRHQVWDWEYKSSCGENKITVFNEVYEIFGKLVDTYNKDASKVLICYSDGMEMWNQGFRPPEDWIVAWSDHGFGEFEHVPVTTENYQFGTYMHAGYWSNHTVHNPYPELVDTVMKNFFQDFDADAYCMVNGQNFRPHLLNIEAYSEVSRSPKEFNSKTFYASWTERYFGKEAAPSAVKAMKHLHKAQINRVGYVQHLWEIREAIAYLSNKPIERPGKNPIPYDYKRVVNDYETVLNAQKHLEASTHEAEVGYELLNSENSFYYSYISLPTMLYSDLLNFEQSLHEMSFLKHEFETSGNVKSLKKAISTLENSEKQLATIYKNRKIGDSLPKWNNWYNPEIRRPNNGFPTKEMLNQISTNLKDLIKQS